MPYLCTPCEKIWATKEFADRHLQIVHTARHLRKIFAGTYTDLTIKCWWYNWVRKWQRMWRAREFPTRCWKSCHPKERTCTTSIISLARGGTRSPCQKNSHLYLRTHQWSWPLSRCPLVVLYATLTGVVPAAIIQKQVYRIIRKPTMGTFAVMKVQSSWKILWI